MQQIHTENTFENQSSRRIQFIIKCYSCIRSTYANSLKMEHHKNEKENKKKNKNNNKNNNKRKRIENQVETNTMRAIQNALWQAY